MAVDAVLQVVVVADVAVEEVLQAVVSAAEEAALSSAEAVDAEVDLPVAEEVADAFKNTLCVLQLPTIINRLCNLFFSYLPPSTCCI